MEKVLPEGCEYCNNKSLYPQDNEFVVVKCVQRPKLYPCGDVRNDLWAGPIPGNQAMVGVLYKNKTATSSTPSIVFLGYRPSLWYREQDVNEVST